MKRKLLAMLLAVCMVVTLIPMAAVGAETVTDFAEINGTKYSSIADLNTAIANSSGEITITLLTDADFSGQTTSLQIPYGKKVILDTAGHTLSSNYGVYTIDISTATEPGECGARCSEHQITDGTHGQSRQYCYKEGGELTITGNGTINNVSPGSTTIRVAGTLNVGTGESDSSTLTITKTEGNPASLKRSAIKCEAEGTVNIYGGTIGGDVRSIQNFGVLNIYGGTMESFVDAWHRGPDSPYAVQGVTSTLNIVDGTFEESVRARASAGGSHATPGNINISGGEFKEVTVDADAALVNYTGTKISGGEFKTKPADDLITADVYVTDGTTFTYYENVETATEEGGVDPADIVPVGNKIAGIGFGWTKAEVIKGIADSRGVEVSSLDLPFIDATLWVDFLAGYDVNGKILRITQGETIVFEQTWSTSDYGVFPYAFAGNNSDKITRIWVYPSGAFTATLYDGATKISEKSFTIPNDAEPPTLTADYKKDTDTLTLTYNAPITGDFAFYLKNTTDGENIIPVSVVGAVGHYVSLDGSTLKWGAGIKNVVRDDSKTTITIENLNIDALEETGTVSFEAGMYFTERGNNGSIDEVYDEKLMPNKATFSVEYGSTDEPTDTPTDTPSEPPITPTVTENKNGTITVSPAPAGSPVAARIMPRYGFAVDTVSIIDAEGNPVAFTDNGDGTYTFTMPEGGVTISATYKLDDHECPSKAFTDLDTTAWYHEALDYVLSNNIMTGTGEAIFTPGGTLTRAMMAQILYNLEGQPAVASEEPFTDVEEGDWYYNAVVWAYANKVTLGTTETTFSPGADVTRQQVSAMLYRYAEYKGYDLSAKGSLSSFTDGDKAAAYAVQPMEWAIGAGVFQGNGDGTINPNGTAKRSEIAQIMMNFCKNFVE